jgi:mRNA-degrading endonuclease RelE of RelBE toxin-antitoxin system
MEIKIHPRVKTYISESGQKESLITHLKELASDPYRSRSGVNIKKLQGKYHDMYRLRVGDHRFEYFIDEDVIWVDNAFLRKRGYR